MKAFCIICSINSKWEKNSNNSFSLINLFFNGFTAAYLLLLILTIWALLILILFGKYVILLLLSSNTINEILGLFISNSFGVI